MIKSIVGFILRILPRPFLQLISKPIFKLISIFYRGKNVECPICNSKFSKFFLMEEIREITLSVQIVYHWKDIDYYIFIFLKKVVYLKRK